MEVIGLSEENIRKISEVKHEEQWILDYRLKSFELFNKLDMPDFGPKFDLDFNKVIYYKSTESGISNDWNKINNNIQCEMRDLGVIESEKHLGGMGVQYESEVIYHNMLEEENIHSHVFHAGYLFRYRLYKFHYLFAKLKK